MTIQEQVRVKPGLTECVTSSRLPDKPQGLALAAMLIILPAFAQEPLATEPPKQPAAASEGVVQAYTGPLTAFRKYPKTCNVATGCVPLILIHGINGTEKEPGMGKCDSRFSPCGLDSAVIGDCNWGPLLQYLSTEPHTKTLWDGLDVYVFRYLSNEGLTVVQIAARLHEAIQERGIKTPPLLVTHSMGGLVARELMEKVMGPCPQNGVCRYPDAVMGTITLATPHHGSPLVNQKNRNWLVYRLAGNIYPTGSAAAAYARCGITELSEVFINSQLAQTGTYSFLSGVVDKLDSLVDPGGQEVCLMSLSDILYWGKLDGLSSKVISPDTPNRSDLLWDDYDGMFAEPVQAMGEKSESNDRLSETRRSPVSAKLVVYGGNLVTPAGMDNKGVIGMAKAVLLNDLEAVATKNFRTPILKLMAAVMEKVLITLPGDGAVPLNSSLFLDNQLLGGRRNLNDLMPGIEFDHDEMFGQIPCKGPYMEGYEAKRSALFSYVSRDIQGLVSFGGPAPEARFAQIVPETASAGAVVDLKIRGRSLRPGKVQLAVRLNQGSSLLRCMEAPLTFDDAPMGFTEISARIPVPSEAAAGPLQMQYELWPASTRGLCGAPRPGLPLTTRGVATMKVAASAAMTAAPKIILSTEPVGKSVYRTGERIQLKVRTQEPGVSSANSSLVAASLFLYFDGPAGRRFVSMDTSGILAEYSEPRPAIPVAPITTGEFLLAAGWAGKTTSPGQYSWRAALVRTEHLEPQNVLAESTPLAYRVVDERLPDPGVIAVAASQAKYVAGDQMVIRYSTVQGLSVGTYDLMLKLTSTASGKDYYFYDDASDSNRWIHSTPRPFRRGAAVDGDGAIPAQGEPRILIETSTPSGTYKMLMYYSLAGKNLPAGLTAENAFRLETPTAEGACFIATAAFGSPLAPAVTLLRQFRDLELLSHGWGRHFVAWYYRNSPAVATWMVRHPAAKKAVRCALIPIACAVWLWLHWGAGLSVAILLLLVAGLGFVLRTNRWARAVFVLIIVIGISTAAEIRGVVVRSKPLPSPIPGVAILRSATGQPVLTSADGRFEMKGLAQGEYKLTAKAPGFLPAETTASLSASTSIVTVRIQLTPIGERSYDYFLPHTAESDGWWSFVSLANPNYTTAEFRIDAFAPTGEYLGSSSKLTSLGVNCQWSAAPASLFETNVGSKAAWYKLSSSGPLTGFLLFGHKSGTMAGYSLAEAREGKLIFPHTADDRQWWTGLGVVSAAANSSSFRAEVRGGAGGILAVAPEPVALKPGEKVVGTLQELFGEDYPHSAEWLTVKTGGPLAGFELFGTRDFQVLAAIPGLGRGLRQAYWPMVATTGGYWTGVAMVNDSGRTGTVRLRAFTEGGSEVAVSREFQLSNGQRSVGVVNSYFTQWPAAVRYVILESDVELHSFELLGSDSPALLGGLPMLEPLQRAIAFPYLQSNEELETILTVVSTAALPASVLLQGYDSSGQLVRENTLRLAARGFHSSAAKALFGTAAGRIRWVKATSDQGRLLGYLGLERVKSKQFTCIPASPVVPAESVGLAAGSPAEDRRRMLDALVAAGRVILTRGSGGVRVQWAEEWTAALQALANRPITPGLVIRSVGSTAVRTPEELLRALCDLDVTRPAQVGLADGTKLQIQEEGWRAVLRGAAAKRERK